VTRTTVASKPLAAPLRSSGKHDPAARRRSVRKGRETGCWVYIPGEALGAAGYVTGDPAPRYRIWGGARGRYIVTLYREA
jgi:hypothetical protein